MVCSVERKKFRTWRREELSAHPLPSTHHPIAPSEFPTVRTVTHRQQSGLVVGERGEGGVAPHFFHLPRHVAELHISFLSRTPCVHFGVSLVRYCATPPAEAVPSNARTLSPSAET